MTTNLIDDMIMKPSASGRITRKQQEIAKNLADKNPDSVEWKVIESVKGEGNADLDTEILKLSLGKIDAKKQCRVCGCKSRHSRHCPLKNSRRYVRLKDRRAMQKRLEEHHSADLKEELKEMLATPEKKDKKQRKKGRTHSKDSDSTDDSNTMDERSLHLLHDVHSLGIQLNVGSNHINKSLAKQMLKNQNLDTLATLGNLGMASQPFFYGNAGYSPTIPTLQTMMLLSANANANANGQANQFSGNDLKTGSNSPNNNNNNNTNNANAMSGMSMLHPFALQQLLLQQEQQRMQQALLMQMQMQSQLTQLQNNFPQSPADTNAAMNLAGGSASGSDTPLSSVSSVSDTSTQMMSVEPNLGKLADSMQLLQNLSNNNGSNANTNVGNVNNVSNGTKGKINGMDVANDASVLTDGYKPSSSAMDLDSQALLKMLLGSRTPAGLGNDNVCKRE